MNVRNFAQERNRLANAAQREFCSAILKLKLGGGDMDARGIVAAGIVVVVAIIVIVNYNSLVRARQRVKNAGSQIEIQLQRRYDLIPNITEIVGAYAKHESGLLEKLTELRLSWSRAEGVGAKLKVDEKTKKSLKSVMAVAENYPELKASANFLALQSELSDVESKIAFARQFFNDTVTIYNTKLETFPSNVFAHIFKFRAENLYLAQSQEAKENIKIQF